LLPAAIALTPLPNQFSHTGALLASLNPQQKTSPDRIAQVVPPLAAKALTPLVRPLTPTGVMLFTIVSSPSWPKLFSPQHLASPLMVAAQVCVSPPAIAKTPPVHPLKFTGVRL
jgi:hypothetical protein